MNTIGNNLYAVLTRLHSPFEAIGRAGSVSEGQFFVLNVAKEEVSTGAVNLDDLSPHSKDVVEDVHGRKVRAYNNWFNSAYNELVTLENTVSSYLNDRVNFFASLEQLTLEQVKKLGQIFKKFTEPVPGHISFYIDQVSCSAFTTLNRFTPTFKEIAKLCDVLVQKMEST